MTWTPPVPPDRYWAVIAAEVDRRIAYWRADTGAPEMLAELEELQAFIHGLTAGTPEPPAADFGRWLAQRAWLTREWNRLATASFVGGLLVTVLTPWPLACFLLYGFGLYCWWRMHRVSVETEKVARKMCELRWPHLQPGIKVSR